MLLTAKTTLYVTSEGGTSQMSFLEFCNAITGGMKLEEVEITTEPEHSKRLERKRLARQEVQQLMQHMTPEQAEKVVDVLRADDNLMERSDDYA